MAHFKDARKRAGYTQKEMAALIVGENGKPLTYQAIQKYENGDIKQYPRRIIEQYMKICRVSADYLLGFSDDPGVNADAAACAAYMGISQQAVENIRRIKDEQCLDVSDVLQMFDSLICNYRKMARIYESIRGELKDDTK